MYGVTNLEAVQRFYPTVDPEEQYRQALWQDDDVYITEDGVDEGCYSVYWKLTTIQDDMYRLLKWLDDNGISSGERWEHCTRILGIRSTLETLVAYFSSV